MEEYEHLTNGRGACQSQSSFAVQTVGESVYGLVFPRPKSGTHVSAASDPSPDLKPLEQRAESLVAAALKAGASAADAVVALSRSTGVDVRDGQVEEIESAEDDAFALRVFVGHRSASVSANRGGDPVALAERAVAMAKAAPENPYAGLIGPDLLAAQLPDLDLFDPTALSMEDMTDRARALEAASLAVRGVEKSSGASCSMGLGGTVLATSDGFLGSWIASRFSLSVSALAGSGTSMERDSDYDTQRHLEDLRDPVDIGKVAGERAVRRLNPQQVETQTANIVFDPRIARSIVGHLAGAVNGASVARKTSFLREDLSKAICRQHVFLVDRPHQLRGLSSRPFDAEGMLPQDLSIVENGVLKNWLLDGATARELGMASNARANRSGSGTSPGTTNLEMSAGSRSPREIMSEMGSGLYVTEVIGQGVSLLTGDYSRGASGYWIENGELTFPVSEVTVAGNLRDMFEKMEPANDLERRFSINAPTIAIEGMTIAGR